MIVGRALGVKYIECRPPHTIERFRLRLNFLFQHETQYEVVFNFLKGVSMFSLPKSVRVLVRQALAPEIQDKYSSYPIPV